MRHLEYLLTYRKEHEVFLIIFTNAVIYPGRGGALEMEINAVSIVCLFC